MAVPARLETVAGKPGVTTPEHVIDPGPEQAQGRCALLPCGQVRPPDGPLAGPGGLPLSPLTCQRGEVIEALAEGTQLPVKPLVLVELLRGEVIEVVFEVRDSVPLRLDVLAEGAQLPVKPLILVELALLAPAEVSQQPGQLGYLCVEPCEVTSTAAGGFLGFGRTPPGPGDLLGWGRLLPPRRAAGLRRSRAGPHRPALSVAASWAGPYHLLFPVCCQWRRAGPARTMMPPAPGTAIAPVQLLADGRR